MGKRRPEEQYENDRPLVTAAVETGYDTVSVDDVVRTTGLSDARVMLVLRVMEQEGVLIEPGWSDQSGRWFARRKEPSKEEPPMRRYDPRFTSKKRLEHLKRPLPSPPPDDPPVRPPFRIGTPWAIPIHRRRRSSVMALGLNRQEQEQKWCRARSR